VTADVYDTSGGSQRALKFCFVRVGSLFRPASSIQLACHLTEDTWTTEGGNATIVANGSLNSKHKSCFETEWMNSSHTWSAFQFSNPSGYKACKAKWTEETQRACSIACLKTVAYFRVPLPVSSCHNSLTSRHLLRYNCCRRVWHPVLEE
jgi:hypothetical protein